VVAGIHADVGAAVASAGTRSSRRGTRELTTGQGADKATPLGREGEG
jgi:hypothetical protein